MLDVISEALGWWLLFLMLVLTGAATLLVVMSVRILIDWLRQSLIRRRK